MNPGNRQELYVLRSWITYGQLNKRLLNKNFCQPAVDYLSKEPNFIHWNYLYKNPYAIDLIREKIKTETDDSYMELLCENPAAIDIIEDFIIKFKQDLPALNEAYEEQLEEWENEFDNDWDTYESAPEHPESRIESLLYNLNTNPKAVPLLMKYPEFLQPRRLCKNHSKEAIELLIKYPEHTNWVNGYAGNPFAIELIKQNFQTVDFSELSRNPEAIFMLLANQHLINWVEFSKNTSPFAIMLMKRNLHRLRYQVLSSNPSAIYLLEKHDWLIDWDFLSVNPKIYVINPKAIFKFKLTKKERNQFGWEYPKKYLVLRRFVDIICECVYNPSYKWCQKQLQKQFQEL
jgi:hypothetical protein